MQEGDVRGDSMRTVRIARRPWQPVARVVIGLNALLGTCGAFLCWHIANGPWWDEKTAVSQWVAEVGAGVADNIGWSLTLVAAIQLACLIAIIGGQLNVGGDDEETKVREVLNALAVQSLPLLAPGMVIIVGWAAGDARASGVLMIAGPAYLLLLAISIYVGTFESASEGGLERLAERRLECAREKQGALGAESAASAFWVGLRVTAAVAAAVITGAAAVWWFRDLLLAEGAGGYLFAVAAFCVMLFAPGWVFFTILLISVLKWSSGFFNRVAVFLVSLMYVALSSSSVLMAWIVSPAFSLFVSVIAVVLAATSAIEFREAAGGGAGPRRRSMRWWPGKALGEAGRSVAQKDAVKNVADAKKQYEDRRAASERARAQKREERERDRGSWEQQCRDAAESLRAASVLIEHMGECDSAASRVGASGQDDLETCRRESDTASSVTLQLLLRHWWRNITSTLRRRSPAGHASADGPADPRARTP